MRSTITARGQTVIPAPIRARFSLGPSQRLEWIVEADGTIRVVPVDPSPVKAFRGMGHRCESTHRLLADREAERQAEQAAGRAGGRPLIGRRINAIAAPARYLGAAHPA